MKIAICDDEAYYREQISGLTKRYAEDNKDKEISVDIFTHAEQLLESVNKGKEYDIFFLDIIMPGMNGIELGKTLRDNGFNEKIIYLTTSDEFAIESYKVNAYDYILKPITDNDFISVLDKVIQEVTDKTEKYILVKAKDRSIKINFNSILYAEHSGRAIFYHLKDGRIIESIYVRTSFSDTLKELVADERFVFCGKSLLLNMHYITEVENEAIIFTNKEKITAGKKLCRVVRNAWADFCFSEVKSI